MTVTNKYVLGGVDFNLNFFLLCIQVSLSFDACVWVSHCAVCMVLVGGVKSWHCMMVLLRLVSNHSIA